tara:strand:- start:364 stop:633 length:270 start_codon:yes stop_codon:yes gene_type:complete
VPSISQIIDSDNIGARHPNGRLPSGTKGIVIDYVEIGSTNSVERIESVTSLGLIPLRQFMKAKTVLANGLSQISPGQLSNKLNLATALP